MPNNIIFLADSTKKAVKNFRGHENLPNLLKNIVLEGLI